MSDDLLDLASALQSRGEPFALATVVRCEPPTSAKPGAKALVRSDGTITGWVGGACAEPVVVREALAALREGRPRLIGLIGDGGASPARTEGLRAYPMTCHSGGTLEIYVEPYLTKPLIVLVGHGPVVETLATIGRTVGYAVEIVGGDRARAQLGLLSLAPRTSVVVATHGDADEEALEHVLGTDANYVSLVASRRRAAATIESLTRRGVPAERLARLCAPAGLDIGARSPQEIAVSILAEIIQHHRRDEAPVASTAEARVTSADDGPAAAEATDARDPICGMRVEMASARHRAEAWGQTVYFCCRQCQDTFERDPARHRAAVGG